MDSILITKPMAEARQLEAFCRTQNIHLEATSFIRFEAVKATIPGTMEALFFGSPRAVDFFLAQATIPEGCAIACIGEATAKHIRQLGYEVSFTGQRSGEPDSVAQALKTWLGTRKLHIAQSVQSNRSMAKALPESQTEAIIVYKTIADPKLIEGAFKWIIFTSPSNLEGFLIRNSVPAEAKVIAWGKTTEKALKAKGLQADFVLESASETEVIEILGRKA